MCASENTNVMPTPAFEGSEKRIEMDFAEAHAQAASMRSIPRAELDSILHLAACCIVSERHGAKFDAYVLSESSLFIHKRKVILKTCGTTKLLAAVPAFLEAAANVGMQPCRVKYSRASFLFPEKQPEMHGCFSGETKLLQAAFAGMGGISGAYVLGDLLSGLQWHVFVAHSAAAAAWHKPAYTLEVCMTGLARHTAAHFVRGPHFQSSRAATEASGIQALLPTAEIDDYVFEPCGYSMNGIADSQCSTIHITPEEGFSYASVELSCDATPNVQTDKLVARIAAMFEPADMAVVMTVDGEEGRACDAWGTTVAVPAGYHLSCDSRQRFRAGGRVTFATLVRNHDVPYDPETVASKVSSGGACAPEARADAADTSLCPPLPPERESECALLQTYNSDSDISLGTAVSSPSCTTPVLQVATPALAVRQAVSQPAPLPSMAVREVMNAYNTVSLPALDADSLDEHVASLIKSGQLEDTFYVMDLGVVAALHAGWASLLPRVRPFYAVKCNEDRALLSTLAASGACFDCASAAEIAAVSKLGVAPERIIFANACKRPSDIRAAKAAGVMVTTADSISELRKLAASFPEARVLLRIRQDDPSARCQLGNKYGAEPADVPVLLQEAKCLGLDLAGVSFHVGSGASNPEALPAGICAAAAVFDAATTLGFDMRILDIGGGFPGGIIDGAGRVDMGSIPAAVNRALQHHFPPSSAVDIIAEPGRFFAEACATLACQVIGTRHRSAAAAEANPTGTAVDYYITDGLYGSFNCIMYDHAQPTVRPLYAAAIANVIAKPRSLLPSDSSPWTVVSHSSDSCSPDGVTAASKAASQEVEVPLPAEDTILATVFGPSCDGLDVVFDSVALPRLSNGDWLLFPRMGAYTLCGASNFNGIEAANVPTFYVESLLQRPT